MDFFKHSRRQKKGVHPHQIVFEKENTENTYITWEDRMKPRIKLDDSITREEYQALASRWDEMLSLAEAILWRNYLDPNSDDLMSEVDSFPDIRYLTGNYYVGMCPMATFIEIKAIGPTTSRMDVCDTSTTTERSGWKSGSPWTARRSPDIIRFFSLHLTGDEGGKEDDYMGLDLEAEFLKLDDPIEFDILSHDVI